MSTGARGEGILTLQGEQYVVLFTLRALADAERVTGKSIVQLMTAASTQAVGVGELAQLLVVGLEYGRRDGRTRTTSYGPNDAWRLMDALGFAVVAVVVLEALAAAMSYSPAVESDGPPA